MLISLLLSTVIQATHASQSDLNKEAQYFTEIFLGANFAQQRIAMKKLEWAGISSPSVYDPLAEKLASTIESKNKEQVEKAAWYAKTLALSGNEKYRSLLNDISQNAKSSKLRKYAKQSISRLDKFIAWNPVISTGLISTPTGQLKQQRVKNMLSTSDLELVRVGAKRVYYAHSMDTSVVGAAVKRLEKELFTESTGKLKADTVAWLIKAVGRSGNPLYKELLEEISLTNESAKIRKHAKKALQNY